MELLKRKSNHYSRVLGGLAGAAQEPSQTASSLLNAENSIFVECSK